MVVQYSSSRADNNSSKEPDHFGDVMSQRETSCMLPGIFKSPIQRVMLTANGNLQRILSSYYNMPVSVEVLLNEPDKASCLSGDKLPIRYNRTINLVCNSIIICSARSTVDLLTHKAANLVIHQGVGIGQLFRYMNVLPTFSLHEAKLSDADSSFERTYELRSEDVVCIITEEFPSGMLDSEFCKR
ncbi:hypothetical protein LPJ66_000747 [Kickxella alabastrina]|uniref:Uncharacterized protein n=1 Tax=Kickxella alabastrina TaxID=61397 RepID=A0ACC1IV33_9FUNG|nr:hypothetical protein LPJ66_000747 [Kickxella alabastrina]